MAAISISHYAIFDYWKDKCIDKYGNVLEDIPENFEGTTGVVTDWGEPSCWCCNVVIPAEREKDYFTWLEEGDFKSIWNSKTVRANTEKAHIVARSLGGEDKPQNLFLLCKRCHKESPDTSNRKMFLSYIYRMRNGGFYKDSPLQKAMKILREDYNITVPYFEESNTKISSHGGTFAYESYVYKLVSDALRNRTALQEGNEKLFKKFITQKINELENDTSNESSKIKLECYKEILTIYDHYKNLERGNEDI